MHAERGRTAASSLALAASSYKKSEELKKRRKQRASDGFATLRVRCCGFFL